jgi:plastocyanin
MATIDITRRPDGTVEFVPNPLVVSPLTPVMWRNFDPQAQHQIVGQAGFAFPPLAPFQEGQEPDTTSVVLAGDGDYGCLLHPGEHGRIVTNST